MDVAARLATEVGGFVQALDDRARGLALLPFDEDERRTWIYRPSPRRGVPLWALDRTATTWAHRALSAVLTEDALARATAIMGLESVLARREGWRRDDRHRDDYWVTVFGEPGAEPWGFRFEGHHVSIHATVAAGDVTIAPVFLGANPAVAGEASAPLAPEERLGFELLHALTTEQRADAVVADVAPDDIVTRNAPCIDEVPTGGVPVDELTGTAARTAGALLAVYLGRIPDGARRPDPRDLRFAWAGADRPGVGHYYRLAGPRLLVELDNTQDGANHVHTVLRDPAGDFGGDVLAAHYRNAHHDPGSG